MNEEHSAQCVKVFMWIVLVSLKLKCVQIWVGNWKEESIEWVCTATITLQTQLHGNNRHFLVHFKAGLWGLKVHGVCALEMLTIVNE